MLWPLLDHRDVFHRHLRLGHLAISRHQQERVEAEDQARDQL